jgi:hypothetical protein
MKSARSGTPCWRPSKLPSLSPSGHNSPAPRITQPRHKGRRSPAASTGARSATCFALTDTLLPSAQTVLQLHKYLLNTLILRSAEDGPLWYLRHNSWDVEKAWNMAHLDRVRQTPLLQFLVSDEGRDRVDKKIKETWNDNVV